LKQSKYWDEHPQEYQDFLKEEKRKKDILDRILREAEAEQ
jgi:hypothetical protein